MLHSVLENGGPGQVAVYYLHGPSFPSDVRDGIAGMVERMGGTIRFLNIPDEWVAGMYTADHYPSAVWYRLFLPELLPDVDKILYLDIDLLVVDSLADLWEVDLGDHDIAAITNVLEPHYAHRPADLGVAADSYFNSGVVLMNLEHMRRGGVSKLLADCARTRAEQLIWVDQDALNIVLGHNRLHLHPRWNCMNSVILFPWSVDAFGAEALAEARAHPAIRHFEGPAGNKPWHFLADPESRELYIHHRRQTPWPRYRPDGVNAANILTRLRRSVVAPAGT